MPARGRDWVGEGSEGKVRAGARRGGGGRERKNILCPPPDARGGRQTREGGRGGGGPGRGQARPPRRPAPPSLGAPPPALPASSPRSSRSPRLRRSNELPRGPRTRFLGPGARWLGRRRSRRAWEPRQDTRAPGLSSLSAGSLRRKLARVECLLCTGSRNTDSLIPDNSTSR